MNAQPSEGEPLTSFADVRALSAEEAGESRPVRVDARVLFAHPVEGWFVHFFYDGTTGIYLFFGDYPGVLEPGQQVTVSGVTAPGDYAPIVAGAKIESQGDVLSLPEPIVATSEGLRRGGYDSQWVKIAAQVRSVRWDQAHTVLSLSREDDRFTASVLGYTEDSLPMDLVGAEIELVGVYGSLFNRNRQLTGFQFYVPGSEFVKARGDLSEDPFESAFVSIKDILRYQDDSEMDHLVRTEGVVELIVSDQEFFLADATNGVRVKTVTPHDLSKGEGVEVVGFAELGEFSPVLGECQFRRRAIELQIEPKAATAETLRDGEFEALTVMVPGRLVGWTTRGEIGILSLRDMGRFFDVEVLDTSSFDRLAKVKSGSLLEVTGICEMEVDQWKQPIGFRLLVDEEEAIKVLSQPSWWTLRNSLMVVAGLVGVIVLAVGWAVSLQRRVSHQTEIIRADYEQRADLQRRYQALFENANDVVFAIDDQGRFTVMNKAGERLLKVKRTEIERMRFEDLVAERYRDRLRTVLAPDRKDTGERRAELRLDNIKGQSVYVEVSFRGIWEHGTLKGFEGIARDLTERKRAEAELSKTQKELVHASRQAGMAEVATGVLHNVGNVLNSVNVSGQTALDLAKKLRLEPLDKLATLVAENQQNPDFLSEDPKGQKVPEYLRQLSGQLIGERETLQKELNSLLESVEHTKDIVSMQQAYARTGGLRDALDPVELVEDAIRMNSGALTRHEVTLVRVFEPTPKISVDRTRILQVLINLIRNAKYACDDGGEEKVLTVGIKPTDTGVRISVTDTGVGIPAENLTKIFAFGFTTRKDGHGFGLHSSALAAKEMDGELTVESDGPGKGASFYLDLPVNSEETTT